MNEKKGERDALAKKHVYVIWGEELDRLVEELE